MITEKQLELSIACAHIRIAILEKNKDNLSEHEYWEIGHLEGTIATLKNLLDELRENAIDSKE